VATIFVTLACGVTDGGVSRGEKGGVQKLFTRNNA
jgi:hypothetical protein